jgi:hypothetical protein
VGERHLRSPLTATLRGRRRKSKGTTKWLEILKN